MTKKELEKIELSKRPLKSDAIIKLDMPDIAKLSDKALRVLASTLVSSSNKRVRRLLNAAHTGISEGALRASNVLVKKLGEKNPDEVDVRFFSVKGKTRNEVLRETRRMIEFQTMKTSTVKGAQEVYDRNERLIFGESVRGKERREREKARELKEWERIAGLKKNQTAERQAELAKWKEAIEYAYSAPSFKDVLLDETTPRQSPLTNAEIMSKVFKFYRQYEENHAQIIKDLGSDFILRLLGAYTSATNQSFTSVEELEEYLDNEMTRIIEQEWQLASNQEEEEEEFFNAFKRHKETGEPVFSKKDGWN